ncbi:MAG: PAS domain S-box protein [Elusimicrobiota bacterium]|jgi:PAS domain S-box-containing protein
MRMPLGKKDLAGIFAFACALGLIGLAFYAGMRFRAGAVPEQAHGFSLLGNILALALLGAAVFLHRRDAAKRDEVQRKLKESEERMQDFLDNATDLFQSVSADGRFIYVNRAWRQSLGYGEEEIAKLSLMDVIAPEQHEHCLKLFKRVMEGESLNHIETAFVTRDGRRIWLSGTANCKFEGGKPVLTRAIFRDVSARRKAEEALAETTARLKAVLDSAVQFAIIATDEAGMVTLFNEGAQRLLGFSGEEIVGRRRVDSFHIEEELRLHGKELEAVFHQPFEDGFAVLVDLARRGRYEEREWTWLRKDGSRRTVDLTVTGLKDAQGKLNGFLGIAVDVTERRWAEQALLQSEERWQFALEGSGDGVWDWDLEKEAVFFSPRWKDILGCADEDVTGRPEEWSRRVHPDDLGMVQARMKEHFEGRAPIYTSEHRMLCKDGSYKWVLDRGKVIGRSLEGRPLRLVGTQTDISERKRVELELRKLSLAVQQSPSAIIITDIRGDIQYVNPRFTEMTGYGAEEILGKNPRVLRSGETPQPTYQELWQTILSGREWRGELCNRRKDGTLYWEMTSISAVRTPEGVITHFVAVEEDVTERRRVAEELARARDAALDAARVKASFLANMSHEIRTPLNAVIGMAGLMLDTPLDEKQKEFAHTIRAAGDSLLAIINDILDFSKLESGKMTVEIVDFDLRSEAEDCATLLAQKAQAKGIELTVFIDPEVAPVVRGDPGRLRQVIYNLLGNAIKFTAKGEVALRVDREFEKGDRQVLRFSIRDTGIGITLEAQKRLFTAFTQADDSTTRRFGGTGLGLAISRQLVELLGGTIGIESAPGRGSTFWFRLALERGSAGADALAATAEFEGLRVLAVDDNPTNLEILRHQLAAWKIECDAFPSAALALERLRAKAAEGSPYRLIITDMQMPDQDGLMFAEAVRKESSLGAPKIILLTSLGGGLPARRMEDCGLSACLCKPVRQSALFDCIQRVMGARGAAAAHAVPEKSGFHVPDETERGRRRFLRILLAEDNEVNRRIVSLQLDKLGYRCEAAADGRKALELHADNSYQLILMDCQMPVLDGYGAAQELRRLEGDGPRVPVVAMTAHALEGDREKCLAAGMDDYLAKPVRLEDLAAVLERWDLSQDDRVLAELKDIAGPEHIDDFNAVLKVFIQESSKRVEELRKSVGAGDAAALAAAAHGLKGASGNVGARWVAQYCMLMEEHARSKDLSSAGPALEALAAELARVHASFQSKLAGQGLVGDGQEG